MLRSVAATVALTLMTPLPALAQVAAPRAETADREAVAFVERLSSEFVAMLNDTSLTKEARRDKFRALLEQNVALKEVGDRLIWRELPTIAPEQYAAYQAALPNYLLYLYAHRLDSYAKATMRVRSTVVRSPTVTEVHSRISGPGEPPVDAVWTVMKMPDGKMMISNLKISGTGSWHRRRGFIGWTSDTTT
jgi:phospholipid transport system substrate-binding protein